MRIERRFMRQSVAEVRVATSSGKRTMGGYGAMFYDSGNSGSQYQIADDLWERLRHGAFDRAIRERHDVRALFNHNPDNLLGRSSSGTCLLSVDGKGLRYSIDINPNDPDHARVVEKVERGDLTGSSFAFRPTKVSWDQMPDGAGVRWIEDLTLYDVGPVTYPAYEGTTIGLRDNDHIAAIREEHERWKGADCDWRKRLLQLWEAEEKSPALESDWRREWLEREMARTF